MEKSAEKLEQILYKASCRQSLTTAEIETLLNLEESSRLESLFQTAQKMRTQIFGDKIFLYGFVYFSTWCRNDCNFCFYRKSNPASPRYRKTKEEIIASAVSLAESGVNLIDLTSGEDPLIQQDEDYFQFLIELVQEIKAKTNLPVMLSPGVIPEAGIAALAAAGLDWYACYQETHNRELFNQLRLDQDYDQRLAVKTTAIRNGLLVEEGILSGVGESIHDLSHSIENMGSIGAHQVRVMSFIPQKGTPMMGRMTPPRNMEMKIIAILRLLYPQRLIPASLDIDGLAGLQSRLNAGANVITSLITPRMGFAGVAQSHKDINEGNRTVYEVLPLLEELGLQAAFADDYQRYLAELKVDEETGAQVS